jgi:hypothetical protein
MNVVWNIILIYAISLGFQWNINFPIAILMWDYN